MQATLGSVLGVASFTDIYREILHSIARYKDVPDPEVQVSVIFASAKKITFLLNPEFVSRFYHYI